MGKKSSGSRDETSTGSFVMSPGAHVLCILLSLITVGSCEVVIPDSVSTTSTRLVYYTLKATWYQAGRLCQDRGGNLMLVDSQEVASQLEALKAHIGSISHIHTRMVRHDDKRFFDNGTCQMVNFNSWFWHNTGDATWDADKQCVLAEGNTLGWKKRGCDEEDEYVCEYRNESCYFQTASNLSLASIPVHNASMNICQSMCQQMIGCFATAPSGDVTLPPFTLCLFLVVADGTNPMATVSCPSNLYSRDDTSDAKEEFPTPPSGEDDPGPDPHDCVPNQASQSTGITSSAQWPLSDFLTGASAMNAGGCSPVSIYPTTVLETVYVTPSPDVTTVYEPVIQTSYVTLTPEIHTVYVTVPLEINTEEVIVSAPVSTVYVTATLITSVTTTEQVLLTSTFCPSAAFQSTPLCAPATPSLAPSYNNVSTNKTKEQVVQEMSSVLEELKVDPKEVSKTRRTKESAPDHRPSAQAMGSVAILLLVLTPLVVLLLDLPLLFRSVCRQPCAGGDGQAGGKTPP